MSELRPQEATALSSAVPAASGAASPPLAVVTAPARDGEPGVGREPKSLPRGRTWILILADMVAIAAALAITYAVAEAVASPSIIAPTWLTLLLAILVLPVWVAIFTAYNLYERQNRSISLATFDEVGELFHALIAGSLFFLILSQVLRRIMGAEVFFPVEAAMFLATALPLVLLTRGSVRSWLLPAIMPAPDADRRNRRRGADGGAQDQLAPRVPPRARGLRGRADAWRRHRAPGGTPRRPGAPRR